MRKKFLYLLSALALTATISAGTLMLAGCGPDGQTENLTDEPLKATTTIADWSTGEISDDIFKSNGWTNGSDDNPTFNTYWNSDNMIVGEDSMKLVITPNPDGSEKTWNEFYGGEARTYSYYGYGDYEVSMKPSNVVGTTSTFFVCTGNYDTNPHTGKPNPWDEIDIEFLGKDIGENKSLVQFNYFVNGKGGHEKKIELPFDASEDFHTYGFRWAEDYITWFVDGKPVYRVDATESNPMPSTAGRILTNFWCGTSAGNGWMGEYTGGGENGPEYQWIKTSAKVDWVDASKPKPPEEVDPIVPDGEVIEIDLGKEGVEAAPSKDVYTVDVKDGKLNVKYNNLVGGYENVQINGITADIQANNVFTAKITNNGTTTANVRVNIFANKVGNSESSNLSATQDGVAVKTDTEWGGSFFTVDAGKTIEIVVIYDTERTSTAVQFMLDSHMGDSTARSGDITISDMTLFTHTEDGEGGDDEPEEPVTPPTVSDEPANVDLSKATIGGNLVANGGPYTATVADGKLNISYADMAGGTWNNVDLSGFAADMADHNVFTATIKNNGTASVNLRIDIMGGSTKLNASATMDGEAVDTDLVNGGSYFTIAAGEEVVIEIVYTLGGAAPTSIQFMPDSHVWKDTNTYTGNITISNLVLKAAK